MSKVPTPTPRVYNVVVEAIGALVLKPVSHKLGVGYGKGEVIRRKVELKTKVETRISILDSKSLLLDTGTPEAPRVTESE